MRTLTAQESLLLQQPEFGIQFRVRVDANGSGSFVDLTNLLGYDWVIDAKYGVKIDQPVSSLTVTLWRQNASMSLATLMTGSLPNVTSGSYVPVIQVGREILVEVGYAPAGISQIGVTWELVFDGFIDEIDWGKKQPQMTLNCRDACSLLVDTQIETVRSYGSSSGTAVETVIQSILTDNINTPGLGNVSLFSVNGSVATPWNPNDSPGFLIQPYSQQQQGVWDAILALVQLFGWDIRYKWHPASPASFRLVLYDPSRNKGSAASWLSGHVYSVGNIVVNGNNIYRCVVGGTSAGSGGPTGTGAPITDNTVSWAWVSTNLDYTFTPDNYYEPTMVDINRADIRNAIRVRYQDATTGLPTDVNVASSASIARYGRRFMQVSKASTSLVTSNAAATAIANAILSDLALPVCAQQVETPYFYAAELCDYYTFKANGVHYDTDQSAAVTEVQHALARDKSRSVLSVRGVPSGGYRRWLGIGAGCIGVNIADGSVNVTGPDPSTFRGENLIPNGDFGNVVGTGAAIPPIGWSMSPPPGGFILAAQGGTWGTDVLEDTTFTNGGQRAIKFILSASTNVYKLLYWSTYIPISVGDVFALEIQAATSIIPPGGSFLVLHIDVYNASKTSASSAANVSVIPTVANTYQTSRAYFRVSEASARFLVAVIGAESGGGAAYNGWIGNIVVRRVCQAANYVFKAGDVAQSIVANTITPIVWTTSRFDIGNVVASSRDYTCYRPGIHTFQASVSLDALGAGKTMTAYFYLNGAAVVTQAITTVAGTNTIQIVHSCSMVQGDIMNVRVQHNDVANRSTTLNDQLSYFKAQLLP